MATFVVGLGRELKVDDEVGVGDAKDSIEEEGDHTSAVCAAPAVEVDVFLVGVREDLEDLRDARLGSVVEEGIVSDDFKRRVFRALQAGDGPAVAAARILKVDFVADLHDFLVDLLDVFVVVRAVRGESLVDDFIAAINKALFDPHAISGRIAAHVTDVGDTTHRDGADVVGSFEVANLGDITLRTIRDDLILIFSIPIKVREVRGDEVSVRVDRAEVGLVFFGPEADFRLGVNEFAFGPGNFGWEVFGLVAIVVAVEHRADVNATEFIGGVARISIGSIRARSTEVFGAIKSGYAIRILKGFFLLMHRIDVSFDLRSDADVIANIPKGNGDVLFF